MKEKANIPNQSPTVESATNKLSTGWEDLAAMANKYSPPNETVDPAKFEKPSEDFDTIAKAIAVYAHCDLSREGNFCQAVMTSDVKRWYPELRAYNSPAKDKFEDTCFKEWKQNIIDLDAQTAMGIYGQGDTFAALKKIHNYLKSGHDAPTQAELLNDCFDGDNVGFDAAFQHLRYDRHSDPGWYYYSSRDEKIGLEKRIDASGRLYLNAESIDTFDIANKFVNACKELRLPYEFKINRNPDRADAMVFYINDKNIESYANIISEILTDNPTITQRVGEPPLLTEKISSKIGYGDETGGASYNERQCERFQRAIESAASSYRGPAPTDSIQGCTKFLYVNHHEKFLSAVKDRL